MSRQRKALPKVGFQAWAGLRDASFRQLWFSGLACPPGTPSIPAAWAWCASPLHPVILSLSSLSTLPCRRQKRPWPKLCWPNYPNKLFSISSIKTCPPPTRSPPECQPFPSSSMPAGPPALPRNMHAHPASLWVALFFFFFNDPHFYFLQPDLHPQLPPAQLGFLCWS